MQCYESEALRLLLFAEAKRTYPDTGWDRFALENALHEFGVERVHDYNRLEPERRSDPVRRANQLVKLR